MTDTINESATRRDRSTTMTPGSTAAGSVGRRRPPSERRLTLLVRLSQAAILVALVGAWHLVAANQWIEPVLAKTPGESWEYFTSAVDSGEIPSNLWATMTAVLISWVLASVAGVAVGVSLGLLPTIERITSPFLDAANAMPRLALAPLLIVVFGITTSAKVALAFTLVFFIVCSSARAGVKSADDEWLRLSTVLNASKTQVFWHILLPVATPGIFAGLRLGLIYSLLGVVGSELISSRDGLGQLVSIYSAQFRLEAVYTILILLAGIAVVLNQAMNFAERYLLRWQPPARR